MLSYQGFLHELERLLLPDGNKSCINLTGFELENVIVLEFLVLFSCYIFYGSDPSPYKANGLQWELDWTLCELL